MRNNVALQVAVLAAAAIRRVSGLLIGLRTQFAGRFELATYKAVAGILNAIKDYLERRISGSLDLDFPDSAVVVLGNSELSEKPAGNQIGLYLHRISVDPFGRNRYFQPADPSAAPQPELAVNLHILLIAWTTTGDNEAPLIAWAMQQIGSALDLDVSHLGIDDPSWGDGEHVQVMPEDMSTEDLLRLWDGLPRDYRLSVPYLVKTLRLLPAEEVASGPPVRTVATPLADSTGESGNA